MINVLNYSVVSNNRAVVPSVARATDCRNLLARDVLRHRQSHVSIALGQTVIPYVTKSRRYLYSCLSIKAFELRFGMLNL